MAREGAPQDRIDQLIERLDRLEGVVREQTTRLHTIEQRLGVQPAESQSAERAQRQAAVAEEQRRTTEVNATTPPPDRAAKPQPQVLPSSVTNLSTPNSPPAGAPNSSSSTSELPPPVAPAAAGRAPRATSRTASDSFQAKHGRAWGDIETRIGGNWLSRIGIVAIVLGIGFFLKYAFDNQWIGPGGRVSLGVFSGIGVLIAGERLRARGYRNYAHSFSGGGILILYLSIYAAFAFYQLIGQVPAFLLMAATTGLAVLLAARYTALSVAMLGLIGGFLTPVLLSTGTDNQAGLFGYIAVLDAGVLALAYYKRWGSLNYAAFAATSLMFAAWMLEWYAPEKLWLTLFFLTLFFLLFSLLGVLHNILMKRRAAWLDISLIAINAALYFGTSYSLLEAAGYGFTLGSFAVLMSGFYLLLFYVAWVRHREDQLLVLAYLNAGLIFFTLALAIQLDQHWVTIGWALEGAALVWMGLRTKTVAPRRAALLIFAVAVMHWFGVDARAVTYGPGNGFVPLLNSRAVSGAVLTAALTAAGWLYWRFGGEDKERGQFITVYLLAANAMALTLLSVDTIDYFEQAKEMARLSGLGDAAAGNSGELNRLEHAKQLALSTLWMLYAAAGLTFGIVRELKTLRIAALVLLGATVFKVLAFDAVRRATIEQTLIFNRTFAVFALLTLVLAWGIRLYARAEGIDGEEQSRLVPIMVVVANLVAVVGLSVEASGYFGGQTNARLLAGDAGRDVRLAQQLSLSVIWAAYGGGLLCTGVVRHSRLLRMMALLLLGVTIIKVFLFDLAELDRFYRIVSFIVLGVVLLAVSFLYQQRERRTSETEGN